MAVGVFYSMGVSGLLMFLQGGKCFKNQYKIEVETFLLIFMKRGVIEKRPGEEKT